MKSKIVNKVFKGDGGHLRLEIYIDDENAWGHGWAKCYLQTSGEETYLGAEMVDDLIPRLMLQMTNDVEGESGAELFGQNAHLVRMLSEAWCGIYVAPSDSGRVFFFLNAMAEPVHCIGIIKVSAQESVTWFDQLQDLLSRDLVLDS